MWKSNTLFIPQNVLILHHEKFITTAKMRKLGLLQGVSFLFVALLLASCGKEEKAQTVGPVKVKEMVVGATGAHGEYGYSGTVEEESGSVLSFTMGGTLTQLRVKVGDRVQKGQLIATVDPTTVRNSYDMARTMKAQAEDAYKRMKQLHDKGSLPEIKWVEAQSQLDQAVSAEKIARKNLSDCNLYAPMSGVVSEKYMEVGQNAGPGVPVVKIVTTKVQNVVVAVPEGEVSKIALRQGADIIVPALQNRAYHGTVVEKGVIADPISRSYSVKIRLANTDAQLLPGMVAKVAVGSSDASSTVIIPANLLQLADDNTFFVWVDEGGQAVRRSVACGQYVANGVIITSGLQNGDKLICEGQQKVCTGTKVINK